MADVDEYTKEVTEGIYSFDKNHIKNQCKLNDEEKRGNRTLKYILLILVLGGILIGALGSSVVTTLLLQECKI